MNDATLSGRAGSLSPMSEQSTATTWGWQAFIPARAHAQMLDDQPMYEAWLKIQIADAHREATSQGYRLVGDPEVTKELGAVIETKEGPMMVGMDMARLSGHEGPPTSCRHRFQFKATRSD